MGFSSKGDQFMKFGLGENKSAGEGTRTPMPRSTRS